MLPSIIGILLMNLNDFQSLKNCLLKIIADFIYKLELKYYNSWSDNIDIILAKTIKK